MITVREFAEKERERLNRFVTQQERLEVPTDPDKADYAAWLEAFETFEAFGYDD